MELHLASGGEAGSYAPLARVTHSGSSGDFYHSAGLEVYLADVADVEMSREDDMHTSLDEPLTELSGIIDHIGCCQRLLHVEMGHQVVVHHGNDTPSGCGGLFGLLNKPVLGRGLKVTAGLAMVPGVTARDECIEAVHAGVNGKDGQAVGHVTAVAERVRIAPRVAAIARMMVDGSKFLAGDGVGGCGSVAVKHLGVGVVDIMVARDDEDLNASVNEAFESGGYLLMAHAFAVLGEVAGYQHKIWFEFKDATHQGIEDFDTLPQHLAVSCQVFIKSVTLADQQLGSHDVQVTDDGYLNGLHGSSTGISCWTAASPVWRETAVINLVVEDEHGVTVGTETVFLLDSDTIGLHRRLVAAEGSGSHQHDGVGHVEVGDQGVTGGALVGREQELVGPAAIGLDVSVHAHAGLKSAEHRCADGAHLVAAVAQGVDLLGEFNADVHLLAVHAVLAQVFHLDVTEAAQTDVHREEFAVNVADFHAAHQFA